jgi:hypothetical protein
LLDLNTNFDRLLKNEQCEPNHTLSTERVLAIHQVLSLKVDATMTGNGDHERGSERIRRRFPSTSGRMNANEATAE